MDAVNEKPQNKNQQASAAEAHWWAQRSATTSKSDATDVSSGLNLLEQGRECIESQMGSVSRRFGQGFDGSQKFLCVKLAGFCQGSSFHQLGQSRTASHRRNAPFRAKADIGDTPALHLDREPQNITAGRILHLDRRIRIGDLARVPWVLEIIEQAFGVHAFSILTPGDQPPGSRLHRLTCNIKRMSHDYGPRRIVSLQPSGTVMLAAIGQLHRLVACTKYCVDLCPEVAGFGLATVSDSWTASKDQILAVRPDLVIAAVPYQEKAVVEILKSGARFLGLAPRNLADIYTDMATIAGMVGAADRGGRVIQEMQSEIEAIRRRVQGKPRPRVFCEEWGHPLIRSQPWVAELVEAAGGEFVGMPGSETTAEAVLQEDPEVFVAAWCGAGDRVPLEKLIGQRHWSTMKAVRQGRVYSIRDEFLNTPAPSLLHGLRALAAAIHPHDFPQPSGLRSMASAAAAHEVV